ncbi:MAG: hypothetical protein D6768_00145 [Chloroflexi bacterium]|nr:MAG: hypothetical protein D6768_00145 [Chloroflexota bacterium]
MHVFRIFFTLGMFVAGAALLVAGLIASSGVLLVVAFAAMLVAAVLFLLVKGAFALLQGSGDGVSITSGRVPASIRGPLREARQYARQIKRTVQQTAPGPMKERLTRTVQPVDEWLATLQRLEQSLARLYGQHNLPREMRRAAAEIEQLRRRMALSDAEGEVASLRALVNSKRAHLAALEELQNYHNQAELKIRKIASDLGTTHAEMLLITTRGNFSESRFQRLDESLQDNLASLRDIVAVMDEMTVSGTAAR